MAKKYFFAESFNHGNRLQTADGIFAMRTEDLLLPISLRLSVAASILKNILPLSFRIDERSNFPLGF
jgi:hypothetical protein